jgi:hypothetical protein
MKDKLMVPRYTGGAMIVAFLYSAMLSAPSCCNLLLDGPSGASFGAVLVPISRSINI